MRSINSVVFYITANSIMEVLAETSEFQTCYRIDGAVLPNAVRCENSTTGHSACCDAGEICWSNGVCQGGSETLVDYLREGCTDYLWSDTACFQVCPWYVGDIAVGVRPCGGISESDSYCCDDGSTGIGSFACCKDESAIFTYDNITTLPTILATIPLRDVLTTTIDSMPSSTLVISTDSDTSTRLLTIEATNTESTPIQPTNGSAGPTESGSSSANANISTALGAGLGVGLPVAAAIIGGVWFMIWRSKRKHTLETEREEEPQQSVPSGFIVSDDNTPKPATTPSSLGLYGVTNTREANAHELPSAYHGRELPA